MNYVETIRKGIAEQMPDADTKLIDLYALLGVVFGSAVNEEDVHNAWSVWQNEKDGTHRSLIPFDDLSADIQALYTKYVEIIRNAVEATHSHK